MTMSSDRTVFQIYIQELKMIILIYVPTVCVSGYISHKIYVIYIRYIIRVLS